MSRPRLICLGNPHASDDGAALRAAEQLDFGATVRAGRPGASLLDMLEGDGAVVLIDVTQSGSEPGTIHRMTMAELTEATVADANVSSHGFGPAQTLQLGQVLGRQLPDGLFVGIEGQRFEPGDELSSPVREALPRFVAAIRQALTSLE